MFIVRKYADFKRSRQKEADKQAQAEIELRHLSDKIERMLIKYDESEMRKVGSNEDECVICLGARAVITTLPCGHRVLCRKCFIKTIQSAINRRSLPLKCAVCRSIVNNLGHSYCDVTTSPILPHRKHSGGAKSARTSTTPEGVRISAAENLPSKSHTLSPSLAKGNGLSPVIATKLMHPMLIYPTKVGLTKSTAFGETITESPECQPSQNIHVGRHNRSSYAVDNI